MFKHSARYYDLLYAWKNYFLEAQQIHTIVLERCGKDGGTLLDVACGTGEHLRYLREWFQVEGVEQQEELITIAQEKLPDVPIHQGDMRTFNLGRTFDVVVCLFSSIGYMKTCADLTQALTTMTAHVAPGGLLILEPWFTPDQWHPETVHMITVDRPDLKIVRMNTSKTEGRMAVMEMHHLIGTPEETEHFVERHELFLAETDEMLNSCRGVGLDPVFLPGGFTGRGLIVGTKGRG